MRNLQTVSQEMPKQQLKIARSQDRIGSVKTTQTDQLMKSLLTVTIIEAQLTENLSTFIHKMSVYCKVTLTRLESNSKSPSKVGNAGKKQVLGSKQTGHQQGQNPKWNESFVFQLDIKQPIKTSHDFDCESEDSERQEYYFIELGIWSSHLLVSDKLVGKAFLKFSSTEEAGSISSWVRLKDEDQKEAGELYVSISKEVMSIERRDEIQNLAQFKRETYPDQRRIGSGTKHSAFKQRHDKSDDDY